MSQGFYKEWDFYLDPIIDYNPKWINYKYKLSKLYSDACFGPKALNWKFQCSGGRYKYGALCYSQDSACKPEMSADLKGYHCADNWNSRDLNVYEIGSNRCGCTGDCPFGVKQVCTYDPNLFKDLGGVGLNNIVKSVNLLVKDKDKMPCDNLQKVFKVTIQLTKITTWDVLGKIKTLFETKSNKLWEDVDYLNFIGYQIVEFYLMMNVEAPTQVSTYDASLSRFKLYIPFFFVFTSSKDSGIIDAYLTRDVTSDFYVGNSREKHCNGLNICPRTDCGDKDCILNKKKMDSNIAILDGVIPQSNLWFKGKKNAIYLVKPVQYCYNDKATTNMQMDHVSNYIEGQPIIYLVYYNLNDIKSQSFTKIIDTLKQKYITNPKLANAPECRAWNEFVYYNHLLPNMCYQVETDSSMCNPIVDYDMDPPETVTLKCSTLTSKRWPDCKTYLMTDVEDKQPKVNQTRKFDFLDAEQQKLCDKTDLMECQCLNRLNKKAFKYFQNADYSFPADMSNNAGCWYRPCLDDPNGNIFIPSAFRTEKRNDCPSVCQNIMTVMNRPENTANFSNLNVRNSCLFSLSQTPKPSKIPTPSMDLETPTDEQPVEEEEPTEEETATDDQESKSVSGDITIYRYLFATLLVLMIVCIMGYIYYSNKKT